MKPTMPTVGLQEEIASRAAAASERSRAAHGSALAAFNEWWHGNHPFDWWAKHRDGDSLPHRDRLLVADIARRAYIAGLEAQNDGGERRLPPKGNV